MLIEIWAEVDLVFISDSYSLEYITMTLSNHEKRWVITCDGVG